MERLTDADNWIPIASGTTIGDNLEIRLSRPVTGSRFRFRILAADGDAAAIKDFQLHANQPA